MTLDEARKLCDEVIKRYGVTHCDYREETADGEVKYVYLTLKIKINQKVVDFSNGCGKIGSKR